MQLANVTSFNACQLKKKLRSWFAHCTTYTSLLVLIAIRVQADHLTFPHIIPLMFILMLLFYHYSLVQIISFAAAKKKNVSRLWARHKPICVDLRYWSTHTEPLQYRCSFSLAFLSLYPRREAPWYPVKGRLCDPLSGSGILKTEIPSSSRESNPFTIQVTHNRDYHISAPLSWWGHTDGTKNRRMST